MKTNIILRTTLLLYLATTAVADTHIKAKYTSDGRVTESVTYLKGERQRTIREGHGDPESGRPKEDDPANLKAKTYRVLPLEPAKSPAKPARAAASPSRPP